MTWLAETLLDAVVTLLPGRRRSRTPRRPQPWQVVVVTLLMVAAVVWAVPRLWPDGAAAPRVWPFGDADDREPAEEAVHEFFTARGEGDCPAVVALLSRTSGVVADDHELAGLDNHELVEACTATVGSFQPDLHRVETLSEGEDEVDILVAVVVEESDASGIPDTGSPGPLAGESFVAAENGGLDHEDGSFSTARLAYGRGRVVREDDEWMVVPDDNLLRIGPSPEETVWRHLVAFRDGRCEEVFSQVADSVWADPAAGRQEAVDRCLTWADARGVDQYLEEVGTADDDTPVLPPRLYGEVGLPQAVDRAVDGDGTVTVSSRWGNRPDDDVPVVRDGFGWRLEAASNAIGVADLAMLLPLGPFLGLDPTWFEVVHPGTATDAMSSMDFHEGDDAVHRRQEHGLERGVIQTFGGHPQGVDLALYEFSDPAGARAYATHLGERVMGEANRHRDQPSRDLAHVDEGLAVVTECSGSDFRPASAPADCTHANQALALGATGRYLVVADLTDYENDEDPTADELLDRVVDALDDTIERL